MALKRMGGRLLGVLAFIAFLVALNLIGLERVKEAADALPGAAAFALLVLLPLAGFPVSVLHVAAGLRFGTIPGYGWVALSIALQLLASYPLGKWLAARKPHWVEPVARQVPSGRNHLKCIFVMLLPGAPYWLKNYSLPALGVPFLTYYLWCLPFHLGHSVVGVVLGGENRELGWGGSLLLLMYIGAMTLGAALAWRGMRRQARAQPKGEDDPTQLEPNRCAK